MASIKYPKLEGEKRKRLLGGIRHSLKPEMVWNLSLDPLSEYFIFSDYMNCIRSLNHTDALGGFGDFQCNNILPLASSVVKAMMFLCPFLIVECFLSMTPNMAAVAVPPIMF